MNIHSTWPLLSWENATTEANADFSFDVTSHIQAVANEGR